MKKDSPKTGKMSSFAKNCKLAIIRCVRACITIAKPFFKLNKNTVLFLTINRKGYGDNLKYIAEALLQENQKLSLIWVSKYPETCDEIRKEGIKVVKVGTLGYIFAQLRAKVVVYNDAIPPYIPKKKGQTFINAWHGAINFKHIGPDYLSDRSKASLKKFALGNPQPDHYISGSRFFTLDTAKSFNFDTKVFLEWGLPRNDLFFQPQKINQALQKIKKAYSLDQQKIVLYAPTFRNDMISSMHELDVSGLRAALSQRFGGEWVVFFRKHYFDQGEKKQREGLYDCGDYPDMQELLAASQVLISDYSSAMWDMSLMGKPVFCYATDIENYDKNERSFACPMELWPYSIASDNEQLQNNILTFEPQSYNLLVDEFFKKAGCCQKPNSAKMTAELIIENLR